ncbi:unnamed protein product [Rotaria sp. Silwood1]|nr:unnamed protein product [Rotaria sp. Silwood1]
MHSFLFVGSHKSQPTQDYSRTSNVNSRDDFIKRAEQDRQKRELNRKQLYAAIKIQTFFRRILAQKRLAGFVAFLFAHPMYDPNFWDQLILRDNFSKILIFA